MKKVIVFGFKVALNVAILLACLWIFTQGQSLITESSDLSVIAGFAILACLGIFVLGWGYWLFGKLKKLFPKNKEIQVVVLLVGFIFSFSSCTTIPPGHVGIEVNNWGGNKGVQDYPLQTGIVGYNPFTSSVFNYPTFVQTAVWTKSVSEGNPIDEEITFNTKEGTNVSGDISLSYQLNAPKVPAFYVKFRSDDLKLFTHGFLRNIARDAFNEVGSNYTLEEVYGIKKEEFLKNVRAKVNKEVASFGVEIVQFGFTGSLRMDKTIMDALNKKLATIQNAIAAENLLRQKTAEANQKVAVAKGDAEANLLLAKSITPQLIQWKQLQIQEKLADKWNGQRAQVEAGNGTGMIIQVPLQSNQLPNKK